MSDSTTLSAKTITCAICGATVPRRGTFQKYCPSCSQEKDRERKSRWAKDHPQKVDKAHLSERRVRTHAARKEAGMNHAEGRGLAWAADGGPAMVWFVRVAVPFDYAISKNHIWSMGRRGHVFLRDEHRAARDELAWRMREALQGHKVKNNRVWLDILVQKPDHKGDGINVLDAVCDALKEVIGLDDRWFSIRRLDWEVVKENPRLIVGIGQEDVEDCQICSYCGRLLPFDAFTKNRSAKTGRGRTCRECTAAASKALRAMKHPVKDGSEERTVVMIGKRGQS